MSSTCSLKSVGGRAVARESNNKSKWWISQVSIKTARQAYALRPTSYLVESVFPVDILQLCLCAMRQQEADDGCLACNGGSMQRCCSAFVRASVHESVVL